jgi:hypothetical protein
LRYNVSAASSAFLSWVCSKIAKSTPLRNFAPKNWPSPI